MATEQRGLAQLAQAGSVAVRRLAFRLLLSSSLVVSALVVGCAPPAGVPDTGMPDGGTDAAVLDGGRDDGAVDGGPLDGGQDGGTASARIVAVSRAGQLASLDAVDPFAVRATADLGDAIGTLRCAGATCITTHPAASTLRILDALTLHVRGTVVLDRRTPRDVAILDDHTALVSTVEDGALVIVDLATATSTGTVDLSVLADADGNPDAQEVAHCGPRAYVQLARIDHTRPSPAEDHPVIAVVDLSRSGADRVVDADPATAGTQGVALLQRPDFDMPIDCAAGTLAVSEPRPLMAGGSAFEQVDLSTLVASRLPIDIGAEGGGFELVDAQRTWMITHTEFGPGPSSHLEWNLPGSMGTYNTFAPEHIDDLALDRATGLLWFPDGCDPAPYPACDAGLVPFHALTGERATAASLDVGFPPIEVELAR